MSNLRAMVERLVELKREEKRIKAAIDEVAPEVKAALADQGAIEFEDATVEVASVKGRKTLDRKLIEAYLRDHGADITDFEKVGAPYAMLKVSFKD